MGPIMLSQSSSPLRSALLSVKLQPTLFTPCTAVSTSTPINHCFHSSQQSRRQLPRPSRLEKRLCHRIVRFASTTAQPQTFAPPPPPPSSPQFQATARTTLPSSSTASTNAAHISSSVRDSSLAPDTRTSAPAPIGPTSPQSLTWNNYLTIRRTRRRYNLLSSMTTSLCTTAGGLTYISNQNIESLNLFGLDPFMVSGLCVAGTGAVGWLIGPFIGNAVFGLAYRKWAGEIAAKEKDLYQRIKKHRVDPSGASSANPVPDYYGEKIDSVQGYRNWMKDQRAFNKKRQNFL